MVRVRATLTNHGDLLAAGCGVLPADGVREVDVPDAVADPGVTGLMVPAGLVALLGLHPAPGPPVRAAGTGFVVRRFEPVRLVVQGRDCIVDVFESGDHLPVRVGRVPLLALDWVLNTAGQRLVGNPAHGGEHMIDALGVYG